MRALYFLVFFSVVSGILVFALRRSQAEGVSEISAVPEISAVTAQAESILRYRKGMIDLIEHLQSVAKTPLVVDQTQVPSSEYRAMLLDVWQVWLDYYMALESILEQHSGFVKADNPEVFHVYNAAFLAQYRFALDFLDSLEGFPHVNTILNEAVSETGSQERLFASYKFQFLNVMIATRFAGLRVLAKTYGKPPSNMAECIGEDSGRIWEMGKGQGETMTLKNARQVIKKSGKRAILPVQTGVANWMGDVRVRRGKTFLISQDQIKKMTEQLRPGDILIQRREWFLSNVGLPGFWTHAAIYVGDSSQRSAFFDSDEIKEWLKRKAPGMESFESLLEKEYPEFYSRSMKVDAEGHVPRVLEAIAEGVVFTSLEHSAHADSMAVLRPKLPDTEIAAAIFRAFGYCGRPYDYEFDFTTESALVCSELVYKAYRDDVSGSSSLDLPLTEMVGRPVLPPNEIARIFDSTYNTPGSTMDLVLFLDGFEKEGAAIESDVTVFRKSWLRPKWHILVQDAPNL